MPGAACEGCGMLLVQPPGALPGLEQGSRKLLASGFGVSGLLVSAALLSNYLEQRCAGGSEGGRLGIWVQTTEASLLALCFPVESGFLKTKQKILKKPTQPVF